MDAYKAAREALSEFCQQDDYLLAHGASLMSADSHEVLHVDTLRRAVDAATKCQAAEIERLRAAEQWVRAQATKYPTKPSAANTYSAGFDVGYALAMEQAARAFDAVPNDSLSRAGEAGVGLKR